MRFSITKNQLSRAKKKIASQTDWNDHNGAIETLAKLIGSNRHTKIIQGVKLIHENYGSMPMELIKIRNNVSNELFECIESNFGTELKNELYGCF